MPSTHSGSPAGDQEETSQRIRRAAREQFGQADFFSVSMSALARAARCSPSAVYQHFGSKQALFLSLCREQEDEDGALLLSLLAAFRRGQASVGHWGAALREQAGRWGQVRRSLRVLELTDAPAFAELEQWRAARLRQLSLHCTDAGLEPREDMRLKLCLLMLGEGLRCLGEQHSVQGAGQLDALAQELLRALRLVAVSA